MVSDISKLRIAVSDDDMVTLEEASNILGVAKATVRRWLDVGLVPEDAVVHVTFEAPRGRLYVHLPTLLGVFEAGLKSGTISKPRRGPYSNYLRVITDAPRRFMLIEMERAPLDLLKDAWTEAVTSETFARELGLGENKHVVHQRQLLEKLITERVAREAAAIAAVRQRAKLRPRVHRRGRRIRPKAR